MGGTSLWKVERNTPVPGRRINFSLATFSMNFSLGTVMVITFKASLFHPSHQATIMIIISRALHRGNQPPLVNFCRQALK